MHDFQLAELIVVVVARAGGVNVKALKGRRVQATLCKLRDTAQFLIRKKTKLSFPEIGKVFQGRDHSSIVAACRREQLRIDRQVRHLPSGLTCTAWHGHILALFDQALTELEAQATGGP